MPSLFISYSRKDMDCARRLTEAFKGQDLDFWIDWEGIPPTVDWWKEVERGIEQADVFLFLVSPDSIRSRVCRREIDHALKNGKRLIPVVVREVKVEDTPTVLSHLNWIFIRENDDFNTAFSKLITAIKTDYEWVRVHSDLQSKALEWETSKRDKSFLLHGTELQFAEFQLTTNASKDPHPTDLQREYVLKSRQAASRQKKTIAGIAIVVAISLVALAAVAMFQASLATSAQYDAVAQKITAQTSAAEARNQAATAKAANTEANAQKGTAQANATEANIQKATAEAAKLTAVAGEQDAKRQAEIARAGELAALAVSKQGTEFGLSLLLSVEAWKASETLPAKSILLDNTQRNPQLIQYLRVPSSSVGGGTFSPNGKTLASVSEGSIILWDVTTRRQISQLIFGPGRDVRSYAFSPDGRILASGSCAKLDENNKSCSEGLVTLWDMETYQPIRQLFGHGTWVSSVAFTQDGKMLASGGDNTIILWDVGSDQAIAKSAVGYAGSVQSLDFSPDDRLLALGMDNGSIVLWDVASRQPVDQPLTQDSGSVNMVVFSPDSKTLASVAGYKSGITLWDVTNRTPIGQLITGYSYNEVASLAFSPDNQTLAAYSENLEGLDGTLSLWNLETRELRNQPLTLQSGTVTGISFGTDGNILASGSDNSAVILWDLEEKHPIGIPVKGGTEFIQSIGVSPDGNTLASAGETTFMGEMTILLWDIASYRPIAQVSTGHASFIERATFSPDGKILAFVVNGDHTIDLWDLIQGILFGQLPTGYSDSVSNLAFSRDGKMLASGSGKNPIILWDVYKQKQIGQLTLRPNSSVTSLAFSPDGKLLASGEDFQVGEKWESTINFWDIENQRSLGDPLTGHTGSITGLAFSPDGKTLASGGWDSTIILWDVVSRHKIGPALQGQMGELSKIVFSPDGKILAAARNLASSGPSDFSVLLWDVASGQPLGQPLKGHSNEISSVVFSPDGKTLASGSHDGTIILWEMDPQSWVEISCQRVGRNLTRAEWALYFPKEEKYRATCPQWPLEPDPTATPSPTP